MATTQGGRRVRSNVKRPRPDTAERILDIAERLVQARGFNAFSYGDVAAELGITRASLHYHFPGKAELGEALIARYTARFTDALEAIDTAAPDAAGRLAAYLELHSDVLRGRRMCLCGMLAADYQTLPTGMQDAVVAFFDTNEAWLERVLDDARTNAELRFSGAPRDTARMIVSAIQGAMLVAQPHHDHQRFQATATGLLASIATAAPASA
jgi:TetR/AcrR family transcriptional regulator, transcriptional repressor for nem operon